MHNRYGSWGLCASAVIQNRSPCGHLLERRFGVPPLRRIPCHQSHHHPSHLVHCFRGFTSLCSERGDVMKARAVHDFYKSSHPMGGFLMMSHRHSRYYHRPFLTLVRSPPWPTSRAPAHLTLIRVVCWLLGSANWQRINRCTVIPQSSK